MIMYARETFTGAYYIYQDFCIYYISKYEPTEISIEMFPPTMYVSTYKGIEISIERAEFVVSHLNLVWVPA